MSLEPRMGHKRKILASRDMSQVATKKHKSQALAEKEEEEELLTVTTSSLSREVAHGVQDQDRLQLLEECLGRMKEAFSWFQKPPVSTPEPDVVVGVGLAGGLAVVHAGAAVIAGVDADDDGNGEFTLVVALEVRQPAANAARAGVEPDSGSACTRAGVAVVAEATVGPD